MDGFWILLYIIASRPIIEWSFFVVVVCDISWELMQAWIA